MKALLLPQWLVAFIVVATSCPAASAESDLERLAMGAAEFHAIKVLCNERPSYNQLKPHLESIYQHYNSQIMALSDSDYVKW